MNCGLWLKFNTCLELSKALAIFQNAPKMAFFHSSLTWFLLSHSVTVCRWAAAADEKQPPPFIFCKHTGLHVSDCVACTLASSRTGNCICESQLIQYFARRETEQNRKWQGWNSVWKHEFLYSNPQFLQHSIGPVSHFLRLSVDAEEGGGDALHTDSTPWWWKPLSTSSSGVTSSILPLSLEPHP